MANVGRDSTVGFALVVVVVAVVWSMLDDDSSDAPPVTTLPPIEIPYTIDDCGYTDVDRFGEGYVVMRGTVRNPFDDATVDVGVFLEYPGQSIAADRLVDYFPNLEPLATEEWTFESEEVADYEALARTICNQGTVTVTGSGRREIVNPGAVRDD